MRSDNLVVPGKRLVLLYERVGNVLSYLYHNKIEYCGTMTHQNFRYSFRRKSSCCCFFAYVPTLDEATAHSRKILMCHSTK